MIADPDTLKRIRAQARSHADESLSTLPELPIDVIDIVRDALGVAYLRGADAGYTAACAELRKP